MQGQPPEHLWSVGTKKPPVAQDSDTDTPLADNVETPLQCLPNLGLELVSFPDLIQSNFNQVQFKHLAEQFWGYGFDQGPNNGSLAVLGFEHTTSHRASPPNSVAWHRSTTNPELNPRLCISCMSPFVAITQL